MRGLVYVCGLLVPFLLAGCHSHYIQASIANKGNLPIDVIEVEYPHASFGTQHLSPGGTFAYRFKLLGSGHISIHFVDAHGAEHKSTGPWLNEGQEGHLTIDLDSNGRAEFLTDLKP